MTEAAKTTTTKKPTTAKAETAPRPAPKVDPKDRPAPVKTGDLLETVTYGTMTVAFFLIFASMIYHFVL
jgi:hypothetical protein